MQDCSCLSDATLAPLLSTLRLRCLDLSWSKSFTDKPFASLRPELRELRLVGCEHLTERLVAHLAERCEALQVLHMSKHLNWIGSSRRELLNSLARLRHLTDLALQDVHLDDELLFTVASLPSLRLVFQIKRDYKALWKSSKARNDWL